MADSYSINDDNFIELLDEDNNPVQFEFVHSMSRDGVDYVVLAPADDDPDEEAEVGVVILKVVEGDDEDVYEVIEDEALTDSLFDQFVAEMDEIDAEGD